MWIITQGYLSELVATQGYESQAIPGVPATIEETINFGFTDDVLMDCNHTQSEQVPFV